MLAPSTLGRLATTKTSARELPQLARFLHRTLLARNASQLPAVRALTRALASALDARRCYATTTSATAPTATVKKAVKAKAATKAAPRKKPARKTAKAPAKKRAAAKSKTKAKAKPAKKAARKKPAAKRRVKKVLTPEAKEKAKIAALRKTALKEPVAYGGVTSFAQFLTENTKGNNTQAPNTLLREIAAKFKNLTPAEREHYNHVASERTAARRAEYQAWIRSHTPEQIHAANKARTQLRRKAKVASKVGAPKYTGRLHDDRQVKRPSTAYNFFFTERRSTSDFRGLAAKEALTLIANEWKALTASEKKRYDDQAAAAKAEYERTKTTSS